MTTLRAQVTIPSADSIPRDAATNTWHFIYEGLVGEAVDRVQDKLQSFYQAIDQSVFSGSSVTGPLTVKVYNLEDPEPRVPLGDFDITITTDLSGGLPTEAAMCLSFRGDVSSGVNLARRRGRIFLGPLTSDCLSYDTGKVIITEANCETVQAAASAIMGGDTTLEAVWAVFSPTLAGPAPWTSGDLELASERVVAGYVDNAFDTIRSRGTDATVRYPLS